MSYITEHFGTGGGGGFGWSRPITFNPDAAIPADRLPVARRAHAASAARHVLGDDADVYSIIGLAEFFLEAETSPAQPALATAPPTPTSVTVETAPTPGSVEAAWLAAVADAEPSPFRYLTADGADDRLEVQRFRDGTVFLAATSRNGNHRVILALNSEQGAELTRLFRS